MEWDGQPCGGWRSQEHMAQDFGLERSELEGWEVVYACKAQAGGFCRAFVLARSKGDGLMHCVEAFHCACCGLAGRWQPRLASLEGLLARLSAQALPGLAGPGAAGRLAACFEMAALGMDGPARAPGRRL